ncbi:MAG TPA: recombinase family protein, partial [Methylomirabilota bacterium]|nr:recombinase family protein [Methylomirabilota bacterium]
LARMLAAAQQTPRPFDAVICMDESRIGRDQYRTGYVLQQLHDAGVAVWFYQEQRQAKLDDATGKFLESVRGFAAEMEREKGRARTTEALRKNARDGHVPAGRVFGYRNVRGEVHSRRVVHEPEAAVVRRIFQLVADGYGLHRVVRLLNDEAVPAPNRDGWAPTTIRAMLNRPLYRGQVVYGATRRVDRGGRQRKVSVPAADWITRGAPELRIINEELWQAAHGRLDKTRQVYDGVRTRGGARRSRPESGLLSKHLLGGFLRCGQCSGTLFIMPSRGQGPHGKATVYYRCTTNWKWGARRCANRWGVPAREITAAVVAHFADQTAEVCRAMLREAWAGQRQALAALQGQRGALEAEVERLDQELARLAAAVAQGGQLKALVDAMRTKQRQRDDVAARLEHAQGMTAAEVAELEAALDGELPILMTALTKDMAGALRAGGPAGRQVLRQLLAGQPITVTPEVAEGRITGWAYQGEAALGQVVAGQLNAQAAAPRHDKYLLGMLAHVLAHPLNLAVEGADTQQETGPTAYQPAR